MSKNHLFYLDRGPNRAANGGAYSIQSTSVILDLTILVQSISAIFQGQMGGAHMQMYSVH